MSPFAYQKAYSLPGGITVKFALNNGRIECEWSPCLPKGKHSKKLLPHYRKARNEFFASLGMNALVIEL